jgi:hypothetical protein
MEAELLFNLDEHEDRIKHLQCVKSQDMASFIWEISHNMFRKWKHDDSDLNVDTLREEIQKLLDEHNISPDELYQ